MFIKENEFSFTFDEVLKNSCPNYCQKPLAFRAYLECSRVCPFATLLKYIQVRLPRSSDPGLFITTLSSFRKVSSDTIVRWIKETIADADNDTGKVATYSCRSAFTSKAKNIGVSLNIIVVLASWSTDNNFKGFST